MTDFARFASVGHQAPCALDDGLESHTAVSVGSFLLPQPKAATFLLVSTSGVVLRHAQALNGVPDLTGLPVAAIFEALSDQGTTSWSQVTADCRRESHRYVWRLQVTGAELPVNVECTCFHREPGAEEWLLRLSEVAVGTSIARKLEILAQAAHQTHDSVLITCAAGFIEYVNPAFERTTGYLAKEVLGHTPRILKSDQHSRKFYDCMWSTIKRGEVFRSVFTNRRKSGELYFEEKTISPIFDSQHRISHYVATSKDVSERIRVQEQLESLANTDTLTKLPNRRLFMERLEQVMSSAVRQGQQLAVLFIDLDRFKVINDTLGHNVGDGLLIEIARRLRGGVRATDMVARLGGDEFLILLEEVKCREDVSQVVANILKGLGQVIQLEGREFFVSASVGIALYPDDAASKDELLSRADVSMYQAKSAGRNTSCFYEQHMDVHAHSDLALEIELHGALARQELFLVYQPIVDAHSGRMMAVEALLRWNSPKMGSVPPDRFIPIMEETGLIVPVSRWSLRQALHDVRNVQRLRPDIGLCFNLSGRQMIDAELVADISAALLEANFDPHLLELEITESTLMKDLHHTGAVLAALDALGITMAIDDFGTGYSSLSYLMRLRVRTLKIDRSFVRELATDPEAMTIVRAIISLAGNLNLEVVGEGVETAEQFAHLAALGCDRLQGYLFGMPSLPADLEGLACFHAPGMETERLVQEISYEMNEFEET
ncbi:MAG: EAL domain-containing protein [Methyloversatilis sp.]|uniref:putative bifunctional diguanylate cyclase/phosphodiesterase n=1 Tax=Methyloversatilis sp. TaxID=2569862 RepID=UPI0027346183|nr:EAL domain-containing protein [Methyloversatilis sp.]MDP3871475.1 EAL domain-containing protein [Methyloversatilis sp.]